MRVAVMGAGGVGGYFGARLAQAGHQVTFIARGAHLHALKEKGLVVESQLGRVHLRQVDTTEDPKTLTPVDLVLVSVKLWDTMAAAHAIKPIVGPTTAVLSLQNGVLKDEVLSKIVGKEAMLGGLCYIAATIAEPGTIRHTGTMQKIIFGEYDGTRSSRAEAIHDACMRGSIDVAISLDIRKAIWEKFVFLVGMSATTTTMRAPIGRIRTNAQTRALLLDLMREVVTVGRAHGVALSPDYAEDRLAFCDGLPDVMTSSMHGDLERGSRLEVPWLSGAVMALGNATNVPTPLNRAVCDILALYAEGAAGGAK